jgi:hypothetical protein
MRYILRFLSLLNLFEVYEEIAGTQHAGQPRLKKLHCLRLA